MAGRHWRIAGLRRIFPWAAPGVGLALVPKCPMCLAGYVAAWTGIGLALPIAAGLRYGLLALCAGALAGLAFRAAWRWRSSARL